MKKLLRTILSPKKHQAREQEKAAARTLGVIVFLLLSPFLISQYIAEGVKLSLMVPVFFVTTVLQDKFRFSDRAIGILMFCLMAAGLIAGLAFLGYLGRLYKGL
jgi:hypothetical protein